jgi:hypothetical protein
MTITRPILLETARRTKTREQTTPYPGFHYDLELGAWVRAGVLLADVEASGKPRPVTKKDDVETGEDRKGH